MSAKTTMFTLSGIKKPRIGRGIGQCDLDGDQTACDGDPIFCKNPAI